MIRLLVRTLAAVSLIMLWGCSSAEWREERFDKISFNGLWDQVQDVLKTKGDYKIDKTDVRAKTITTQWSESLYTFSFHSTRDRAIVEIQPLDYERAFMVRIRVEQQVNKNMDNPTSSKDANWSGSGDDPERAEQILHHLRVILKGEGGPSKEFYEHYEKKQEMRK